MERLLSWFASQGWTPFDFQRRAWDAYLAGISGLVHAPTGVGKTLAVWGGPLIEAMRETSEPRMDERAAPGGLRVLWVTPLRALANDTAESLRQPLEALRLPWAVQVRTGDTPANLKASQRKALPAALVTTPESLSLLLSYPDSAALLGGVRCVVVDEWHELLGTKRGVQVQLALARLGRWSPVMRTWGLSATLGNLDEAMAVLMGSSSACGRPSADGAMATAVRRGVSPPTADCRLPTSPTLIHGELPKRVCVDTVRPRLEDVDRFPWSGHLGTRLVGEVVRAIDEAGSTLLFTNTRSQVELWFQSLLRARPDWIGQVAVHHGSLDAELRRRVEDLLRQGKLRCVVCTSSLDLGVDFSPVDQVLQVGSPKGVARFVQRAGRSGHAPGATSRIVGVPTHAMELVEFAAAREALERREIESRQPPDRPLDTLVQHLVTVALGGGFVADELRDEVRRTHAFARLSDAEWQWALDFVTRGGEALRAYERYARVARDAAGRCVVPSPAIARRHRMAIGTISSETSITVAFLTGQALGTIEEGFIGRLKEGDKFVFAGRLLRFVRLRNMIAYVEKATGRSGFVPRWLGGKSPLSTQLAAAVRRKLQAARDGRYDDPELQTVRPVLELQGAWSIIPGAGELLIESLATPDGHHLFVFPFEGRAVHDGLAALLAYRLTRAAPRSVTTTVSDYGIELLSPDPFELDEPRWRDLCSTHGLLDDLLACLNVTSLARGRFRDIARVAGLIFSGYPGQPLSARQLQGSSELFFDVFTQFDPGNLLLDQARREVLERELEVQRLRTTLQRIAGMELRLIQPPMLTPLSFPLWAESLRTQHVSSEPWIRRVRRMVEQLDAAATRARPWREGEAAMRFTAASAAQAAEGTKKRGSVTPRKAKVAGV